jgi:diguanylate cyclase (GGDEF)-like protein
MSADTARTRTAAHIFDASLKLAAIRAFRSDLPMEPATLTILVAERDQAYRPLYPAITRILHEEGSLGRRLRAAAEMLDTFDNDTFGRISANVANESGHAIGMIVETARSQRDRTSAYRSLLRLVGPEGAEEETVTLLGELDAVTSVLHQTREEKVRLIEQLAAAETASQTDALTGIPNRRSLERILASSIDDARGRQEPLSIAILDIDHFKAFNDLHGHETGDLVLRLVVRTVAGALRDGDTVARLGGEEFVVVLPRTDLSTAVKVTDRLRRTLEARDVMNRRSGTSYGKVTASFGVASLNAGETGNDLLRRADEALYAAKRAGRNRVEAAG